MKKQILLSIPHMRAVNILKGNIRVEVCKRIPKKFIGGIVNICDGDKVVGRFNFNRYTRVPVRYTSFEHGEWTFDKRALSVLTPHLLDIRTPLSNLAMYSKGKDLYLWHIDNIEVFKEPKPLNIFYKPKKIDYVGTEDWIEYITKAPQTWRFVIEREDEDDTTAT